MSWLGVFVRAVVVPAARRASSAWLGCAVIAGLLFGNNGMSPRDVTTLAQNNLAIGGVLALTWTLIYLPSARVLVRADAATYLRSLPAPRWWPRIVVALAFVGLQLPWLVLWTLGAGLFGLAVVGALSLAIAALAAWRPRLHARRARWRTARTALTAIHLRALARRAGDALLRGTGLAILAGCVGGLFVANNALTGAAAAVMGASVIAIVLVPAQVAPLLVLHESHRATAWLAASLGITPLTRTIALASALLVVHGAATAIALVAFGIVAHINVHVVIVALTVAVGSSLGCTRVLLADDETSRVAARAVAGAIFVAAAAVFVLAVIGIAGALGFVAAMFLLLLR